MGTFYGTEISQKQTFMQRLGTAHPKFVAGEQMTKPVKVSHYNHDTCTSMPNQ